MAFFNREPKFIISTRPLEESKSDCSILARKGLDSHPSPAMKIMYKNKIPKISPYDAIVLSSRHAAYSIKRLNIESMPVYCVGSSTAKVARKNGAKNLLIGNSDIKALANLVSKTLSRDSRILWLSGNYVLDNFSPLLKQFKISVDKFNVYISKPIEFIDHKSIELIANNKVKVILFYSSESTKIWMKLIKNANLYDKIKLINLVGISNKTFSSISEENEFKYYLSRRKRRASVLAKAIEIFKMPEISK